MRAHHIMTRKVISVRPDTSAVEAANTMLQQHISGLPDLNEAGELVGIISEGDFIRRAEIGTGRKYPQWLSLLVRPGRAAADFVHEQGRKVGEIMTPDPLTVTEDTPLEDIVEVMEKNHVKRLPVVRGDQLVGIVTRANLLQAVANLARDVPDPTADDDHIRDRVFIAIEKNDWKPTVLRVAVRNGIVHLSGAIFNERSRQAAIVAAENVSGVREVHDHLCWLDPVTGAHLYSPEDDQLRRAI
jgi:CBS domain-containing protein